MKMAVVIDDIGCLDYIRNELPEGIEELEDHMGMKAYSFLIKGRQVKIYFFKSLQDAAQLKALDLFLFEDLELIINVGYCFCAPEQNKVHVSDFVVIGSSKCDHSYRESMSEQNDAANRRILEIDKSFEKKAMSAAEKLGKSMKAACCCSVTRLNELDFLKDSKLNCGCFDQKAYAIYERAKRYNRHAVCLYRVVDHTLADLEHYLLEKPKDLLNDLVQIALEFEFRCRIK